MDAAPDSPAMPLRALLPDGSVDAVPTRRADDVAVSRATGTLGIATTSSTTRGREEASSSSSTTFVLRTRAAVVGVVLRAGADGVAAAGGGGAPPTLTLSTGDDVPAVSSAGRDRFIRYDVDTGRAAGRNRRVAIERRQRRRRRRRERRADDDAKTGASAARFSPSSSPSRPRPVGWFD